MNISKKIRAKVESISVGEVFSYSRFGLKDSEYIAASKAIERLIKSEELRRLSRGYFYKPENSVFGELKPSEKEIIKTYLFQGDKRISYYSGVSLYNKLGLTTQVPSTIILASYNRRINRDFGSVKVKSRKSYVEVTEDNYKLLEILDAIKDIKKIPDVDLKEAITLLKNKVSEFKDIEIKRMIKYSKKYPPRVRALLGAILESVKDMKLDGLKNTLNPLTVYNIGVDKNQLPTSDSWSIR